MALFLLEDAWATLNTNFTRIYEKLKINFPNMDDEKRVRLANCIGALKENGAKITLSHLEEN